MEKDHYIFDLINKEKILDRIYDSKLELASSELGEFSDEYDNSSTGVPSELDDFDSFIKDNDKEEDTGTKESEADLENAGEIPPEEEDEELELLVSKKEPNKQDISLKGPIKTNNQSRLARLKHNRKRIRHHGSSKTDFIDFGKMLDVHKNDSMNSPFDQSWIKSVVSNPLGETKVLTKDLEIMLEKMGNHFGINDLEYSKEPILQEGLQDIQDSINPNMGII